MNNRIKHALYLNGWNYKTGDRSILKAKSTKILASEYLLEMKGHLFCPECFGNLFRSPEDKPHTSNGKEAYFAHSRGIKTDCGLRTKRAEGKKYENEEEAKKAIQNDELVILKGFIKEKPETPNKKSEEYDATQIEDLDGPITEVAIGRHNGETFKLPSKFKTVRGICNKFDENLYKYFYMPNSGHAIQLLDLLNDIESVTSEDDRPKLYFGKIIRSFNAGSTPKNIRMTKLKFDNDNYQDFYFKLMDELQQEKGIDDEAVDRVILIYGIVTSSGSGLCIQRVGWGEFSLLPKKYEYLLY